MHQKQQPLINTSMLKTKASQLESLKEETKKKIREFYDDIKKHIDANESVLLAKIDSVENTYALAICKIESSNGPSLDYNMLEHIAREPVPSFCVPSSDDLDRVKKVISELTTKIKIQEIVQCPQGITGAALSFNSIRLTWEKNPGDIRYQVEMRKSNEGSFFNVYNGSPSNFTVTGLAPETKCFFRIRAVSNSCSVSEWSEIVEVVTRKISVPINLSAKVTSWDTVGLSWCSDSSELMFRVKISETSETESTSSIKECSKGTQYIASGLKPGTTYIFRVQAGNGNEWGKWSEAVTVKTYWNCVWKECPCDVDIGRVYQVSNNTKITKIGKGGHHDKEPSAGWCTIIGNASLPQNKVTSWKIKMLKSYDNGCCIFVGAAPFDINQNEDNPMKCGWYFHLWASQLCSGPPHNYKWKDFGPRKGGGEYVHTGDSVGVVMDTTKTKGELSFVVSGVNLGVAFEGIPLDKPLVPCVLLSHTGDSVELII